IYDNMKTAVQTIFAGKSRQYNRHLLRMTSHYLIEPVACTPAAGWEKGQVEHQVGLARKRIFTPRLRAASLRELNELLQRRCEQVARQLRHPEHAGQSRWEVFEAEERGALMPLPPPFDGFTEREVRVTTTALVHFERNRYSVDGGRAGKTVALRACPRARLALAHLTEPEPREPHKWPQRAKEYLALAQRAAAGIAGQR
ncbi:MAG: Mu transposase domain-containing protein, partial [Burkholderiaceae bacterium]